MEFYFPINKTEPQDLRSAFKEHIQLESRGDFPDRLGRLVFSPVAGFLKGYMDLVFQFRDRFYLLDWKSNYLGPTIDSYRQDMLKAPMQQNFYFLQYHLYSVALTRYLRLRKPGFRYESDFGGVFYIFIRGVDSRHGSQFGIFYDLPKQGVINALGRALIPGFEEI
jgi:exodeoxyribonuclease V beta subunit